MYDYYGSEDIARVICKLSGNEDDETTYKECEEAIYDLKCICENPYNRNCYRTLWNTLQQLTEKHYRQVFK